MHRSRIARTAALALSGFTALAFVSLPAAAQIAPGSTLTFTGTADATDIGLKGVMLDFSKRVTASASGNTGAFAWLNGPGTDATGKISGIRVGNGAEYINDFFQIGDYKFSLNGLPSGSYPQAPCYTDQFALGQTCTPFQSVQGVPDNNAGLSPFYVANVSMNADSSLNSTAAFDLFGTVTGPAGTVSSFSGTIASAFPGTPYQIVLYTLENYGLQGLDFTGTFTVGAGVGGGGIGGTDATVTPEPTTVALVVAGLLGVVGVSRRRRASRMV